MGEHIADNITNKASRSAFIQHLLNDISALEQMLENNQIEDDIVRIGAEQEFCLVTDNWRPAKNAEKILASIDDPHFTTEIARFNLEINLDPLTLVDRCFSNTEEQLNRLLDIAKSKARDHQTELLLTGILPTISKNELDLEYMTQSPRYWALNDMIKGLKGADFELHIMGVDELSIKHDSVLFEACNTSFQMHLQIPPGDFISSYNWSQAISGPVLGICANSPLLLGRDLWSETRIALFQQSIDTRRSSYALKDQQARVTFGNDWAYISVAEIFKDDITQFNVILSREIESDSLDDLSKGTIPKLAALCMHNGTVYRWNRPCYGISNNKPHLRIENRYIPSGPSVADEMANFAFWVGLMQGRPSHFDDMPACMDFREAKSNFIKAARNGKESVMNWMGKLGSIRDLVTNELLPIAHDGLKKMNIDTSDIKRLLGIIDQRAKGLTGAQWQIGNYRTLRKSMRQDDALLALTKAIHTNQQGNTPIHKWPQIQSKSKANNAAHLVGHVMSTQLYTVKENDSAVLATKVMSWKNIHHVPVENTKGDLCGLLTWTHMERLGQQASDDDVVLVSDIMTREVVSVQPETEISKAITLMKKLEIGCLPVLQSRHVVGLITIKDVIEFDK